MIPVDIFFEDVDLGNDNIEFHVEEFLVGISGGLKGVRDWTSRGLGGHVASVGEYDRI
jgi:hypothetical protein